MVEPVSITAGVLTMLRVSLSAVGTLKSATTTPSEFARLEKELEHFRDIISDVEKLADDKEQLTDSLAKNMNNARLKVKEINDFFGNRIYRADSEPLKVRRTGLIKETSRLRSFARDIEAIKAKLIDCLAVSNLSNKLHIPSQSRRLSKVSSQHSPPILDSANEDQDPGPSSRISTLSPIKIEKQSFETSEGHSTDLMSPNDATSIQSRPIDVDEHQQVSPDETATTVASLIRETQRAMILKDTSLGEHIAQIFRELSTNRLQIQRLTETLSVNERKWQRRWRRLSNKDHRVPDRETSEECSVLSLSEHSESEATIFFDCVSRFSETISAISLQRLQTKFSGSPDYFLETNPTFLPERYDLGNMFDGAVSFVAMKNLKSIGMQRTCKMFLLYSRTPRAWQKVTVAATIISSCQNSVLSEGTWTDNLALRQSPMYGKLALRQSPMYGKLENQLQSTLKSKTLLETVTNLSMTMTEDAFGEITVDASSTVIEEDHDEASVIDEQRVLQDIDDMACPQFLESQVIVLKRRSVYEYLAHVESQECVETKVPFAKAGFHNDDIVRNFIERLKQRLILQGCENVTKFIGVVLDDSRKHLRSCLVETVPVPSICWMLIGAEAEGKRIPWLVRELWAKQIVSALANIHAKGFVMGGLSPRKGIGIRADGSVVLEPTLWASSFYHNWGHYQSTRFGTLSPELRNMSHDPLSSELLSSFRQDLFYLGLTLWLIAQHRWTVLGLFCTTNACSNWPRHSCTAAHANPVELPRLTFAGVPEYFDTIVGHCRRAESSARLPATALLRLFGDKEPPPGTAELLVELVKKYEHADNNINVNCDECGSLIVEVGLWCAICDGGDFDLCLDCVSSGVPCRVKEHRLQKFSLEV